MSKFVPDRKKSKQVADDFKDAEFLCDLIEEMFIENPACLLSSVCRGLIVEKAREVKEKVSKHVLYYVEVGKYE